MLGKILFTIGVILVVALVWGTRRARPAEVQKAPRLVNPPGARRAPIRTLALAVVVLMLLGSTYLLYEHWRDGSEVIFIRVVDAPSGRTTEYRARRGDIEDREFVTTDGRRIMVAETERLETSTIRAPSSAGQN